MKKVLQEGVQAPDFNLPDAQGNSVRLKSLLEKKPIVLYFYPKDMTPGCTQEACDFRDSFSRLRKKVTLLGVSFDSPARHLKFLEKYDLPFLLLSDEEKKVARAYGVYQKKKFMGKEFMGIVRTTFLIDKKGLIQKMWSPVKVKGHIEEVLSVL